MLLGVTDLCMCRQSCWATGNIRGWEGRGMEEEAGVLPLLPVLLTAGFQVCVSES